MPRVIRFVYFHDFQKDQGGGGQESTWGDCAPYGLSFFQRFYKAHCIGEPQSMNQLQYNLLQVLYFCILKQPLYQYTFVHCALVNWLQPAGSRTTGRDKLVMSSPLQRQEQMVLALLATLELAILVVEILLVVSCCGNWK